MKSLDELSFVRTVHVGESVTVHNRPHYGTCTLVERGNTHATVTDSGGVFRTPLLTSLRSAALGHTTVTPPEKAPETPTEPTPRTGT